MFIREIGVIVLRGRTIEAWKKRRCGIEAVVSRCNPKFSRVKFDRHEVEDAYLPQFSSLTKVITAFISCTAMSAVAMSHGEHMAVLTVFAPVCRHALIPLKI